MADHRNLAASWITLGVRKIRRTVHPKGMNQLPGSRPRLCCFSREASAMFNVSLIARECSGCVVVALYGELDIADAADVAAALAAEAAGRTRIVVDLAGLTFIDCSGVRALALARTRARHEGCVL